MAGHIFLYDSVAAALQVNNMILGQNDRPLIMTMTMIMIMETVRTTIRRFASHFDRPYGSP